MVIKNLVPDDSDSDQPSTSTSITLNEKETLNKKETSNVKEISNVKETSNVKEISNVKETSNDKEASNDKEMSTSVSKITSVTSNENEMSSFASNKDSSVTLNEKSKKVVASVTSNKNISKTNKYATEKAKIDICGSDSDDIEVTREMIDESQKIAMKSHNFSSVYSFADKSVVDSFRNKEPKRIPVDLDEGDTLEINVFSYVHSTLPDSTMGVSFTKKYTVSPYIKDCSETGDKKKKKRKR